MRADDKGMSQLLVLCKQMNSSKENRQKRKRRERERKREGEGRRNGGGEFLCIETCSVERSKVQWYFQRGGKRSGRRRG